MRLADSALVFLESGPGFMRHGTQDSASPRTLNLSQVVASVFHFRIVNIPTASISIHFRKFSARQISEITIVNFRRRCRMEISIFRN